MQYVQSKEGSPGPQATLKHRLNSTSRTANTIHVPLRHYIPCLRSWCACSCKRLKEVSTIVRHVTLADCLGLTLMILFAQQNPFSTTAMIDNASRAEELVHGYVAQPKS